MKWCTYSCEDFTWSFSTPESTFSGGISKIIWISSSNDMFMRACLVSSYHIPGSLERMEPSLRKWLNKIRLKSKVNSLLCKKLYYYDNNFSLSKNLLFKTCNFSKGIFIFNKLTESFPKVILLAIISSLAENEHGPNHCTHYSSLLELKEKLTNIKNVF